MRSRSAVADDKETLAYLASVDSPTLSNAIELLKVRPREHGFAPLQLRCFFPHLGPMCGYAVTAHVETMTQTAPLDRAPFLDLFEAVERSPKPAVVVLQEIGGLGDFAAHCGEVMATIFRRSGAIGLVSDCAVRDLAEVRAMGFHYFARGAVASHANFRIIRSGVPVQVLNLVVQPGDLLHGDENGLLLVPKEHLPRLPEAVEEIRLRERELMEFVRGPDFTMHALRAIFLK